MRRIILDTETTGLSWERGHRIVEIGAIELFERRLTGQKFHRYLNPECEFEAGAQEVTGLTLEFLADKPKFADIVDEFLAFIDGAELVIHNAAFDVGFLNHELSLLKGGHGHIEDRAQIEDTLLLARRRFPGQRNSLDALCKRFKIDDSHRQLHGALLDAQLLCEVYLALTSGQEEIGFATLDQEKTGNALPEFSSDHLCGARRYVMPTAEESMAHQQRLAALRKKSGRCLWDEISE